MVANNATSWQKNQVEQVFKVGTRCWVNKGLVWWYKKEMQKEIETKAERRTQHSTSGKLFNGAHRGAEALVEIQFFDFFILFFVFFSDFVSLK